MIVTTGIDSLLDTMLNTRQPTDPQLSPDGQRVAFVLGETGKRDRNSPVRSAIHIIDVGSGRRGSLTAHPDATHESPRWSPDGRKLIFTSNRANPDEMQLYLIDTGGGEGQCLTDLRGSVLEPEWSPDGRGVAFLYDGTLDKKARPDPDPIVFDTQHRYTRVWLLDIATGALCPITPETISVHEYAWSPDGKSLALIASTAPNPLAGWYEAKLYVGDVSTGEVRAICDMPHQIGAPAWSPDGRSIAFLSGVCSDQHLLAGEVYVVPVAGGPARVLTPDIDHTITWVGWHDAGIVYGGRYSESCLLGLIDPDSGERRILWRDEQTFGNLFSQRLSLNPGGDTFATVRMSFNDPPQIFTGSLATGEWRQRTDLYSEDDLLPTQQVESRQWTSPDGAPVQGFLIYPQGYDPDRTYPLFVHVHGGPSFSYLPAYGYGGRGWHRLIAAKGCFVLQVNPRGSWGRGHAYQRANVGDLGGGDWEDINAGVDHLIDTGLVDPDRLAIGGWSYGGYMAAWAITQTDRFKLAVAGAPVTSMESAYPSSDIREWQSTMFGMKLFDDVALHRARSPLTFIHQASTPTLILQGVDDVDVEMGQAVALYIGLKHFGVPTELVLYPREPHGFQERPHQRDVFQRIADWIDRYLLA